MGKRKRGGKIKSGDGDTVSAPCQSLADQIQETKSCKSFSNRIKSRSEARSKPEDSQFREKLGARIKSFARLQRMEEKDEEEGISKNKRSKNMSIDELSMDSMSDEENVLYDNFVDEDVVLDPEDEAALETFFIKDASSNEPTLWDLIDERIREKQVEMEQIFPSLKTRDELAVREMGSDVVEMYKKIGVLLSTYRSGRIPKAFKLVSKMVNWEQILYLTNPDGWSAAAMYQATRLFASNLSVKMCERFYRYVLLPRLRDDIEEYKKLNFHLYQALCKALYKPRAFFKGIILPLCQSGTCTLREAVIFGSVLTKISVPMLHAAVTLLKIAEMEYSGSNSLFLRILIDKKFTLPYRAIDAIVDHFLRFHNDKRKLPVLWHQSLLSFARRYKKEISEEQREALVQLVKVQNHYQISPEVVRELRSFEAEADNHIILDDEQMEYA